ncbi:MAG: gamma carbonic anhydrase family protein [Rhodobacteraceae bacterium]|nr:gamma carbonic anhydrase family protein [Paracoccaceae bacterium]
MTLYHLDAVAPDTAAPGTFWVAPGAHVIGRVTLSAGTSVWFGAVLRGDNEPVAIGPGSNVQEHVIGHTDPGAPLTVGANCTIGHRAILHGCTVGDGSLVGMGATILNHARIGRGCLIGAGALVTERKEIPDGALVMGTPARVVRLLSEAEREALLASAAHYRANMARFQSGLGPLQP